MIYLDLFLGFLKVGCFSFGGAYAAIPLIRDVVLSYGWMTEEKLTYMIAVSESTPGPIMINLATFVGNEQAGLLGALLATATVAMPAVVLILLITKCFGAVVGNPYVSAVMQGLKPCIIGIILATGFFMLMNNLFLSAPDGSFADVRAIILAAILLATMFVSRRFLKKKISPILLIAISAVLGIVLYSL